MLKITIEEFIETIHKDSCTIIEVERLTLKTGNTDGSGNYSIIKFKFGNHQGAEQIEFNNSSGSWTNTA